MKYELEFRYSQNRTDWKNKNYIMLDFNRFHPHRGISSLLKC